MRLAASQQPANPAAISPPTANTAASQAAIELVNEGNGLLDHKDFAGAEAAYRKALQNYPAFAAAHRGLGIALWRQGELGLAWQEMNTVARLEPDSARAHYELGQLAWSISSGPANRTAIASGLSAGDFRAIALGEVEKAVSLATHDFNMRVELAEMELGVGQNKKAQADALGAVSLASSPAERARADVALGRAYSATGDEVRAETAYQKAIEENPSSGAAYLGLGQIFQLQQNPVQALKYFNRAVQVSPELAPAYAALGKLYVQNHQPVEALAMMQKAVALSPDDWQNQYELARLLLEAGQSARAKELFTKIVAAQPDFLAAGEQLALMSLRQGDVQGAVTQAQKLLARDPRAVEGHRVLALAFWRQRQVEASLAECAQALAVDPRSTSMLALQSLELWQTRRKADAQRVLREVARANPEILSPVSFCRQIVCGSADVSVVGKFLREYRWVLGPPNAQ